MAKRKGPLRMKTTPLFQIEITFLSCLARVDEKTIRKAYRGEPIRPGKHAQITKFAIASGIPPPPPYGEPAPPLPAWGPRAPHPY